MDSADRVEAFYQLSAGLLPEPDHQRERKKVKGRGTPGSGVQSYTPALTCVCPKQVWRFVYFVHFIY